MPRERTKVARTMRQLTDLTPRQTQRLKQLLAALKGLRQAEADELMRVASSVHSCSKVSK